MKNLDNEAAKRRSDPVYGWGCNQAAQTTNEKVEETTGMYRDIFGVTAGQVDESTFELRTDDFGNDDNETGGSDGDFSRPPPKGGGSPTGGLHALAV